MEAKTKVTNDDIVVDDRYVSPEVAAAQAGETVVFDMDVTSEDENENDTNEA